MSCRTDSQVSSCLQSGKNAHLVFYAIISLVIENKKAVKRMKSSIIWTYYTALMLMVREINSVMKKPNWNGTWSPGLICYRNGRGKQVLALEENVAQAEETNCHSWMTTISNRERKSSLTLVCQSQVLETFFSL